MRQLKEGTLQLLLLCFTKQSLAKIKLEIAAFSFSQFRWQHGLATILLLHSWNEPVYQYFFPCASLNILILPKLIFWAKWQPRPGHLWNEPVFSCTEHCFAFHATCIGHAQHSCGSKTSSQVHRKISHAWIRWKKFFKLVEQSFYLCNFPQFITDTGIRGTTGSLFDWLLSLKESSNILLFAKWK